MHKSGAAAKVCEAFHYIKQMKLAFVKLAPQHHYRPGGFTFAFWPFLGFRSLPVRVLSPETGAMVRNEPRAGCCLLCGQEFGTPEKARMWACYIISLNIFNWLVSPPRQKFWCSFRIGSDFGSCEMPVKCPLHQDWPESCAATCPDVCPCKDKSIICSSCFYTLRGGFPGVKQHEMKHSMNEHPKVEETFLVKTCHMLFRLVYTGCVLLSLKFKVQFRSILEATSLSQFLALQSRGIQHRLTLSLYLSLSLSRTQQVSML